MSRGESYVGLRFSERRLAEKYADDPEVLAVLERLARMRRAERASSGTPSVPTQPPMKSPVGSGGRRPLSPDDSRGWRVFVGLFWLALSTLAGFVGYVAASALYAPRVVDAMAALAGSMYVYWRRPRER